QKTAYEIFTWLEFRRVLFRSMAGMAQVSRLTIRLHDSDDVVIARAAILPGTPLDEQGVTTAEQIPAGHKTAVRDIAAGQPVRKRSEERRVGEECRSRCAPEPG